MSNPPTGRGLGDVQRLALRNALDDVEQDDVAEFLETDQVRERAPDLTSADQGNASTCHGGKDPWRKGDEAPGRAPRLTIPIGVRVQATARPHPAPGTRCAAPR